RVLSRRHRRHIQEIIARIEAIEQAKPETRASGTPDTAAADSFLSTVIVEVERGLATGQYGVAQIAQRLNMSEQTFRRRLTEATGKSPKLFISAMQMERAAHLLTTNRQLHISEVAAQCGFGDAETFSRAFKRVYGCAPTHYRP
ncbi:MAG: helix-turn-helix transcriptional regulator, partial [Bacteroidales bacterium]|nr:helix-turn-helix transcriptional regulator [Bacteroidales bacterium]